MSLEANTYTTSCYIGAPLPAVAAYASDGMNLNEYTLFSRMHEKIDEDTWLGTASGYQNGLYYHVVRRDLGPIQVVEWHCGAEYKVYHHVYPMLAIEPRYFGSKEGGTYYHWISFVDPARTTPMITQGLPTVHRSEARSMKSQLERRAGHRRGVDGAMRLEAHTIYVAAPLELVASYLADPENLGEWSYLMRQDGVHTFDDYDHPIDVRLRRRDLGEYAIIEHDTRYLDTDAVVRSPMLVIPASYAFGNPAATGVIVHRLSAWPTEGERAIGKASPDDYNTEAINMKRILEARANNLTSYAKGCSYALEAHA